MNAASLFRLLFLAALWGGSFLFVRVAAPVLGPAFLVEGRVLCGALFLLAIALYLKKNIALWKNWRYFGVLGFFNSAVPFTLFGFAALHLTASQLAVLNATAPAFGYMIGLAVGNESFSMKRALGVVLGAVGVFVLFNHPLPLESGPYLWSIAMTLGAAACYGIATNYTRKVSGVSSFDNAHGSLWSCVILLLPTLYFMPIRQTPDIDIWGIVVLLGVFSTGLAYLLYFRLVQDIGAASALTVTFLIPIFATLWGYVFLGEAITANTLLGMGIVIVSTAMVTGFSPSILRFRAA